MPYTLELKGLRSLNFGLEGLCSALQVVQGRVYGLGGMRWNGDHFLLNIYCSENTSRCTLVRSPE
jgi:hypothetical protein